jgi:hypothetical protein
MDDKERQARNCVRSEDQQAAELGFVLEDIRHLKGQQWVVPAYTVGFSTFCMTFTFSDSSAISPWIVLGVFAFLLIVSGVLGTILTCKFSRRLNCYRKKKDSLKQRSPADYSGDGLLIAAFHAIPWVSVLLAGLVMVTRII